MQEWNRCKTAGFPDQMIGFEKTGQDPVTGSIIWRLMEENGTEHKHKFFQDSIHAKPLGIRRRRVVDIAATISNIPHYILAKRQ
jgi:hypothetical protein